jgi:hypothetical protein
VFDASGKMIDGLSQGNTAILGHLDECLDINVINPTFNGSQLDSFRYFDFKSEHFEFLKLLMHVSTL